MIFPMTALKAALAARKKPDDKAAADPYSPMLLSELARIRKMMTRVANAPRQSVS